MLTNQNKNSCKKSLSGITVPFLANVNSHSCLLYVVARPSVVCNVRAPYSGDWNFRQSFYTIWYLGHLWAFSTNFTEIIPGEPLRWGGKHKRGSQI